MAITAQEAREQILDDLGTAIDRIALACACLGEAYEHVSVTSADRLEAELFRPTQKAFGRCKRAHGQFAERFGFSAGAFESPSPGAQSLSVKDLVEKAVTASAEADHLVAELQDSMLPIEFGDPELRAALAEVRELLSELPRAATEFLRTLGR